MPALFPSTLILLFCRCLICLSPVHTFLLSFLHVDPRSLFTRVFFSHLGTFGCLVTAFEHTYSTRPSFNPSLLPVSLVILLLSLPKKRDIPAIHICNPPLLLGCLVLKALQVHWPSEVLQHGWYGYFRLTLLAEFDNLYYLSHTSWCYCSRVQTHQPR